LGFGIWDCEADRDNFAAVDRDEFLSFLDYPL
jgi:hypothetical protein